MPLKWFAPTFLRTVSLAPFHVQALFRWHLFSCERCLTSTLVQINTVRRHVLLCDIHTSTHACMHACNHSTFGQQNLDRLHLSSLGQFQAVAQKNQKKSAHEKDQNHEPFGAKRVMGKSVRRENAHESASNKNCLVTQIMSVFSKGSQMQKGSQENWFTFFFFFWTRFMKRQKAFTTDERPMNAHSFTNRF